MKLLLDTHAFLWWIGGDSRLLQPVIDHLTNPNNEIFLSAVSVAEISIKVRLGKLQLDKPLAALLPRMVIAPGLQELPLQYDHALRLTDLPMHHRDPFDRMLIAQAISAGLSIVTGDAAFRRYAFSVIWA